MIVCYMHWFATSGFSQRKAVRSKHKQLVEDEIDSSENDKQGGDLGTLRKSGSQDSADSTDDLSVRNNNSITETTMAVPKEERRISITLTTSGGPSKTFITDLKTTDLNMVNQKQ